ncbi:MAG: hypothetical protein LKG12_03990 [Bifidobacterium tibiigranuli]|jgi:CshA-type fibril repeat protein|nr:hypothetical protein [Bifidobacterium tibiigranuli]
MSQSSFLAPGFGGKAIPFNGGLSTVDLASCSLPTPPTAGDAEVPANPDGSATLTPPVTPGSSPITSGAFDNGQPTKEVPGEGTWNITVDPQGQPTATFTPEDGFTGDPTPQDYTVADKNGLTSDPGKLTVTKPAPLTPPTTGNASKTINPNTTAEFAPGDLNTVPGSGDITDVKFDDPAATDGGKTLVVPGEGTWTIKLGSDGKTSADFTPETDYSGPVTEQPYTVTDSNDKTATGKLDVTINTPPTAKDKSATTDPGKAVTLDPETGFGTSKKFTGVAFDDKGATTKDVPGEGTWTITLNDKGQPEAVFTPVDGFTGKTTAVPYIVTDENGLTAKANLDVTVNKPLTPPTTGDKSATINPNQTATLNPVTTPGSGDITGVKFDDPAATDGGKTLVVPGEGTWTIKLDNGQPVATFAPLKDYSGKVTPQKYTVTDANKLTADGTLNVTINPPAPVPPKTGDASKTIDPNETATLTPKTTPGSGDITGVKFDDPAATDGGKTLVVPGEGTWTIKLDNGQPVATFAPLKDYSGKVTPQKYTVTDANKLTADGTLNVTINPPAPVPPKTGDKSATTNPGTPVTLNPVTTPGSSPIKSIVFDNGQPKKVVPGEGTWTVELKDGQPVAVFTPEDGFTGKTTPQPYTVTDGNGLTATGKLDVTVNTPPTTGDKSATTNPKTPVTLTPKTTSGSSPIKSVVFDNGQPTKDVPNEGTWSVKLDDKGQPEAVFTPVDGFTGKTPSQPYTVTDENGLTATGKLDVTVNTPPTTGDKSATTNPETPVTLNPVTTPGSAPIKSVVFDNGKPSKTVPNEGAWTVKLDNGQPVAVFTPVKGFTGKTPSQPYTVTDENGLTATGKLDVTVNTPPATGDKSATTNPKTPVTLNPVTTPGSAPVKSVVFDNGKPSKTVPGQGTWTVELKDGQPVAKFTPEDGFTGKTTPQDYTVADGNGLTATGKLDVTVNTPPATGDKSAVTNPGTPVTLNPVTKPGSSPIKSVVFDNGKPSKDVPGEGTWTVKLDNGQPVAVFTPADGFTGKTTPQPYTVTDGNGLTATGKLDVTVNTPPTTGDKSATTNPKTPVTLTPKTTPGSSPITSVTFDNGQPSKDVPNEGTWSVKLDDKGQPEAVFTPVDGFTGKTTPQPYTVTDGNGLTATGKLDVTVNTPPATGDNSGTTDPGKPVTLAPVTKPGSSPIKSVVFDNGQPTKVVSGEGTWTIQLKDGQPVPVFTPADGFTGKTTPQPYTVTDENGLTATGKLDVTVNAPAPVTPPTTGDKSETGEPGKPVTLNPVTTPGSAPIKSAVFDNGKTVKEVPGEGVWAIKVVDGQPVATFTPAKGFSGKATPQKYTVTDENGKTATGTLGVDVPAVPAAPAKPAPKAPAAPAAPAKQPQSILASTGASVGIALVAMLALAAAGLGLRKLSRRNGSD